MFDDKLQTTQENQTCTENRKHNAKRTRSYFNRLGRTGFLTAETADTAAVGIHRRIVLPLIVPPINSSGIDRTYLNASAAFNATLMINDRFR